MFVVDKKDFDVQLKNKIQECINNPELQDIMHADNGNSVICGFGYVQVINRDGDVLYQSNHMWMDVVADIRKICGITY